MTIRLKQLFSLKLALTAFLLCASISSAYAADAEKLSEDQKLSAIFAEHLATSNCKATYVNKFKRTKLTPQEKQQLDLHTSSACKCLYNHTVQLSSPTAVSDYIMNVYGARPNPDKPSPDVDAYVRTPEFKTVTTAYNDPAARKKCGFIK